MKKVLLADSGFWIALLREKDNHHKQSKCVFDRIRKYYDLTVVIPWPTLYEFLKGEEIYLSYRFIETIKQIEDSKVRNIRVLYYPDNDIREKCLEIYRTKVEKSVITNRKDRILSLVDMIILETIKKVKQEIYPEVYLLSYDNLLKSYNRGRNDFKLIDDLCREAKFDL